MKHIFIYFWGFATAFALQYLINNGNKEISLSFNEMISYILIVSSVCGGVLAFIGITGATWNLFDKGD